MALEHIYHVLASQFKQAEAQNACVINELE